ncbi:uncharacterized protein LOC133866045 [Alnus glutinosa]|uniref:uncharacterized protein LOC133866045 n=1 Tax=Alnus glutinosa TaxID=3517 RepID=UPI002D7981C6|nr:uncharacterized protein LOC133866045 [Alnus glutinosa]
MVLSWIINSVSKEIAASVISVDSTETMWNDLRDRFSQQNGPQIFQVQKAISAMSQEDQSVSSYFTAHKGLWDECIVLYRFVFVENVLVVFSLVVQHKCQSKIFGDLESMSQNTAALLAKAPSPSQSTFTRPAAGNPSRYGKSSSFVRKDRPTCNHYGISGHTMEKCY